MPVPTFRKQVVGEVINNVGGGQMNTFMGIGDIDGDGLPDIAVSGRNGRMVWLRNPGKPTGRAWEHHVVADIAVQECGGTLYDLTGNGKADIINGSAGGDDKVTWWENPGTLNGTPWDSHIIVETGKSQIHNTLIGDVKNDGRQYLVYANQGGGTRVFCVPLPSDPKSVPWRDIEMIIQGKAVPNPHNKWSKTGLQPEEGLALGDIDGDGRNELVCGTCWCKWTGTAWEEHRFAGDEYMTTKVAIGDIDGCGRNEIVLAEGDAVCYGRMEGGKLAWFKPGDDITAPWVEHRIDEGLTDAHSLEPADLCGNGRLDIYTAEIGRGDDEKGIYVTRQPRLLIYENNGDGSFTRHVVDEGTGTHESVLVDMTGNGKLDIAGKPLWGPEKWNVHVWYQD